MLAPRIARASVIWLHGLGADGHDFVPIVPELRLPDALGIRFVFPHASIRPVTLNNGYRMRAWYDIKSLSPGGRGDQAGLDESVAQIAGLMAAERAGGIDPGRIVIAGFSQGGAVALHAALSYPERLAGVMALSAYLPFADELERRLTGANRDLPVLQCHGRQDPIVAFPMGEAAHEWLEQHHYPVAWHEYPMQHAVCPAEIADIGDWLRTRFA
ncbi:MAG TPA: alpha/beta fold hydrolase [Candidatus Acidoferrales bacterium]|nr:alpha/beta fold hydrolase [Candidatus Acidoferrales bacterium]